MLLVRGVTYRIDRTEPHCYAVVRLLDDVRVGTFCTHPAVRIHPLCVEDNLMRDVVRAALRSARTSAVMHVAPVQRPDDERESSPSPDSSGSVAAAPRTSSTSSSVPPPESALA
jgi:hypothetical protein